MSVREQWPKTIDDQEDKNEIYAYFPKCKRYKNNGLTSLNPFSKNLR